MKKYPFPDSDLSSMLDGLVKKNVIQLPTSKRPKEAHKTNDPNFCRYHRVVSHPIEKCVTLKEKIMQLAGEGKIIFDGDEAVESNHVSVMMDQYNTSQTYVKSRGQKKLHLQAKASTTKEKEVINNCEDLNRVVFSSNEVYSSPQTRVKAGSVVSSKM